ncbi:MAG TPA: metallophosphoesterase [Cyclobacteriaceae bacterium]|nr:metallophosphoesterase [Cyclobacteriaceae bacterium]
MNSSGSIKEHLRKLGKDRYGWAGLCFVFAILALIVPLRSGNALEYFGGLLILAGVVEILDGFKRVESMAILISRVSGALSLLMGTVLINASLFQKRALVAIVIGVFILDAIVYLFNFIKTWKNKKQKNWFELLAGMGNLVLVLFLLMADRKGQLWSLSVAVGLRMTGVGLYILWAKTGTLTLVHEDVLSSIGVRENPYVKSLAEKLRQEEEQSAIHDRRWIIIFIVLLFVIHLGRMGFDRSALGILSPLVATFGDMVIALIITYAILAPIRLLFLRLMRKRGARLWNWITAPREEKRRKFSLRSFVEGWLTTRMRAEIRYTKAGYSLPVAARMGLKIGLPLSALLAAVMPVLGMSWYFDTENWASGIWDKWAADRADVWRMAITHDAGGDFGPAAFRLQPPGVTSSEDFSFVVVGDPGEGDASQLVLKDQIIKVTDHPDVKFLVISSDVVYPTGALKDYEKKFWMPFKGVTKPVYAIPGNHDWYDALDGFIATFFTPEAAKKAMTDRVNADLKLTSTTGQRIDEMITQSDRWRKEYEVPTGFQNAPYFQISTDQFVFISVETGVLRQIDSLQRKWLANVLEESKGKFVMVLLGHPFYAIGEYQGVLNPDFDATHDLLRKYNVPLVMAGDTHDLEYYLEPPAAQNTSAMHHFVNGGGGAYLSIGTAMTKPADMPTKDYAYYPPQDPLVEKIQENTRWYKWPAWWWTRQLDGWPFSAEWLSAMFDYNVSPFFQSFMEIRVETSKKRVVLIPYSNHGRIPWRDMTSTHGARPDGATMEDFAEWVIPMR